MQCLGMHYNCFEMPCHAVVRAAALSFLYGDVDFSLKKLRIVPVSCFRVPVSQLRNEKQYRFL